MGGVAGLCALLADAAEAVNGRGLAFVEHEVEAGALVERVQHVSALRVQRGRPVFIPHAVPIDVSARDARSAAAQPLGVAVLLL